MPTRIDFAFDADARLPQAARSTLRHAHQGTCVYVYCDDSNRLAQFSQLLWTISDTTFLAHEWLHDTTSVPVLVYLVDQANWPLVALRAQPTDWLLNLDDDCPPEVSIFTRVLEIVDQDDQDRQLARQRWRLYQSMGLDLHAHQLSGKAR
jgi:DNA polymerase-3 subunit chi